MLLGVSLLTLVCRRCGAVLVTSVDNQVARPLIDSMVFPTVVRDDRAAGVFPAISPRGFEDALRAALDAR